MSEKLPNLICDTSFVGHLTRRIRSPERYRQWDDGVADRVEAANPAVSFVTVAEARAGYLNARLGGERMAEAEQHLSEFQWLPIRQSYLAEWARLRVAARACGIAIGDNDLWVAATASVRELVLVTCDRDHVRIASELGVEVLYFQPPV